MRKTRAILIFLITLCSCSGKQTLPPNYIPILYASYIFIEGSIKDSIPSNLLLDTGADNLYLDSTFYSNNKIIYKNMGEAEVVGIGNSVKKIPYIKDSVNVQFYKYKHVSKNVPIVELKSIGGDFIDGLFSLDFFKKGVFEINYEKNYMAIWKNTDSILNNKNRYMKIPMRSKDYFYCIPLSFNIDDSTIIEGDFFIDVGSPMTTITSSAAKKFNLSSKIKNKVEYFTKYGGVGGESAGYDFIVKNLSIGDYILEEINMSYSLDEGGFLSEGDYIGMLGNNVLEKFDLIFDFDNEKFYLKPNKNYYNKFEFDKLGFTYVDRNKTKGAWVVTGLTKNSEASLKLKIDDKIIEVDGIPVSEINLKQQQHYFDKRNNVILTIENANLKKEVSLTLIPLL